MPTPELAGHLSAEELGRRYRAARDRAEHGHHQVVWLLRQGRSGHEVARVMGYSGRWVAEIARRCNEGGPEGLADRRRGNAGAKGLALPAHLRPTFLPPYSPELQPAERLWPLADEAVANRRFDDLAALSDALEPHCLALAERPELIRGRTLFGWWPQAGPAAGISRI